MVVAVDAEKHAVAAVVLATTRRLFAGRLQEPVSARTRGSW